MSLTPPDDARSSNPNSTGSLNWGLVGTLHRLEPLLVVPGQTGVVRLVPNTVHYSKPPLGLGWSNVKSEPGRYEMVWPGNPALARSLDDVGRDLRKLRSASASIPPDHPLCRELDAAVMQLVSTAQKLQKQDWGVGLLTPTGTLLFEGTNGVEVALVDLGFAWKGDFGDPPWDHSPGKPDWLIADPNDNPMSLAWDRPPVEQQFASPVGNPFANATEVSSLRTVARVIAWSLTGTPHREINPDSGPVWNVLAAANRGELTTFAEFADRLRVDPPSSHFAEVPVLERGSGRTATKSHTKWIIATAVLLLGAAAGLVAWLNREPNDTALTTPSNAHTTAPTEARPTSPSTKPTSPSTKPSAPAPTPSGSFQQQFSKFQQLPSKDLLSRLSQFLQLANAAGADPAAGKQVESLRPKLFDSWVDECQGKLTDSAEAANRADAGFQLRKLVDQYRDLHEKRPSTDPKLREKERSWLDHFDQQATVLGWPR